MLNLSRETTKQLRNNTSLEGNLGLISEDDHESSSLVEFVKNEQCVAAVSKSESQKKVFSYNRIEQS